MSPNEATCILCKGEPATFLYCDDFLTNGGAYRLVRCNDCGFVWTIDAPDSEGIGRFYDSSYEERIHPPFALHFLRQLRLRLQSNSRARMIQKKRGDAGRVLDIGCGNGNFLLAMKRRGWATVGVEPSAIRRKELESAGITMCDAKSWHSLPDASVDVITLWHSLEHLHGLPEAVTQIARILKPGGHCIVAVPNAGSPQAQRDGARWFGYDVPRHLWHFTPKTLTTLLGQHQLKVEAIRPMRLDPLIMKAFISVLQQRRDWLPAIISSAFADALFVRTADAAPCMLCIVQKR